MKPIKLLASRNIIIGIAVLAVVFVLFAVFQMRTGSTEETLPLAERISPPPIPTGESVALDAVLASFQRGRATTMRKYHASPLIASVDTVTEVNTRGWAEAVTVGGGRATFYFTDSAWHSINPSLAPGQTRSFTCADWQSGPSGTVVMYGCGVVERPDTNASGE
jgi:hypothetical protein